MLPFYYACILYPMQHSFTFSLFLLLICITVYHFIRLTLFLSSSLLCSGYAELLICLCLIPYAALLHLQLVSSSSDLYHFVLLLCMFCSFPLFHLWLSFILTMLSFYRVCILFAMLHSSTSSLLLPLLTCIGLYHFTFYHFMGLVLVILCKPTWPSSASIPLMLITFCFLSYSSIPTFVTIPSNIPFNSSSITVSSPILFNISFSLYITYLSCLLYCLI